MNKRVRSLFLVVIFAITPSSSYSISERIEHGLSIAAALTLNGLVLRNIEEKGWNRYSSFWLGASLLTSYGIHRFLYQYTPKGYIDEARKLYDAIDEHLFSFAYEAQEDNNRFFERIDKYYANFALPLAEALMAYNYMLNTYYEVRALLGKALNRWNRPNKDMVNFAQQTMRHIDQESAYITYVIKLIKKHPDFLPQYTAYQEWLTSQAAQRVAYAAMSNATANWANAVRIH